MRAEKRLPCAIQFSRWFLAQEDEDKPCPLCGISPRLIRELKERIEELSRKVEEQAREIDELKRRLSRYENSNTPPSRSTIYREMREKRKEERQQ
jgi:hypothetical protein